MCNKEVKLKMLFQKIQILERAENIMDDQLMTYRKSHPYPSQGVVPKKPQPPPAGSCVQL